MSFQSGIHAKMAIFDRKSHAPETSEGSESGSILLVRLFFICQATFLSFDILSVAWAERGFRGAFNWTLSTLALSQTLSTIMQLHQTSNHAQLVLAKFWLDQSQGR